MQTMQDADHFVHHYETHGTGRPVLFMHGLGASTYSWRHVVPSLSKTHQVILVDLKGFGSSPKPCDDKYSIYDQADLMCEFIARHDLRNLSLVGHSLGGGAALVVALRLVEQEPSRLASLVLIDSVGYEQPLPTFVKILKTPILGFLGLYLVPCKTQVRSILKLAYYDDTKVPEKTVEAYARALAMPGGRHALSESATQLPPRDIEGLVSAYHKIRVPTLVLWGRHDEIVPLDVGKKLHDAIPNSSLEVIEDCGHIPHEEQPEASLRIIEDFLKAPRATQPAVEP